MIPVINPSYLPFLTVLSGFGILPYKLAENKDPDANYGQYIAWGVTTITIAWLPGVVKTILLAIDMKWREKSWARIPIDLICLFILALIWPVFSIHL